MKVIGIALMEIKYLDNDNFLVLEVVKLRSLYVMINLSLESFFCGAGEEIRTLDPNLGKVTVPSVKLL